MSCGVRLRYYPDGLLVLALSLGACGRAATAPPVSAAEPPTDIVYERTVGGNLDLYLVPATPGVERRLTDHPAGDALPRWTRDGRVVLFSSERSGRWQLWEVAAEGGAPRRVRATDHAEWQADPAPDGKRIVFLSEAEGRHTLCVFDRLSGGLRTVVRHGQRSVLGNPQWSPDMSRIAFSSNWRIGHQVYVADAGTGAEKRISPLVSGGCEPRFSPDGRKVAYVSRGHLWERTRLVEHDLASGEETVLVDWPSVNYDPVYSPDGSEIAFVSNVAGVYAVYRQRLRDRKSWRMSFGPGDARHPDYRPRP